jgi:tritrans,polycis-undecaprenyl-diphosphate synthase [geranylgeranyl-diphosphate specific]
LPPSFLLAQKPGKNEANVGFLVFKRFEPTTLNRKNFEFFVKVNRMPLSSIAFIPDGNRRFAQKNGISLLESYRLGTQKAWEVIDWLRKYPSIKTGTFYTLSFENLTRNKTELSVLFKIFDKELDKAADNLVFEQEQMNIHFVGKLEALPKRIQSKMHLLEKKTSDFKNKTIHLAIGYSGQNEIVDAAKKIAEQYKQGFLQLSDITTENFSRFLYAPIPEPDLIVRTSGTQRLSGFLTYQSAYSELYFTPKYWPEFEKKDLAQAIQSYENRKRNFGK